MSDTAVDFSPGERVEWARREGETLVKRQVKFIQPMGADECIVEWGMRSDGTGIMNRWTARLDELSRPGPPPLLSWVAPPIRPTPPPPSVEAIATNLEQRRDALRAAHDRAKAARDAVTIAEAVASRAVREVNEARARLVEQVAADEFDADEYVEAIRRGDQPAPRTRNGADRDSIRTRVALAETAADKFDRELADANAMLAEALSNIRREAASVIAALVSREAEALRRLETEAARQRSELVAVSQWWPDATIGAIKLPPATATLLANPPSADAYAMSSLAPAPGAITVWRKTFDDLVSNDPEADFTLDSPAER